VNDKKFYLSIFGMVVVFALLIGGGIWATDHFRDHHTGNYSVVHTEVKSTSTGKVTTKYCRVTLTDGAENFTVRGKASGCEDIKAGTVVGVHDGKLDQDFWTGKISKESDN
jgi:hypothetical protein